MGNEQIFFHKGLSSIARSALQEPGSLALASNIVFSKEGAQGLRPKFTAVNTTAIGIIHSCYRFGDRLIVGDGTHLRGRSATTDGDFTDLGSAFADAIWRWKEFKKFLHGVNGTDQVLLDSSGYLYPAQVANPTSAPSGAAGAGGNPNGQYYLYVTYLITWPNGMTYETGFSDASANVTVTSDKISWTDIPISPYVAYSGTEPTIHRKLYRGPGAAGTLTDIYYVATIEDNTTTTYTDDASDVTLAANGAAVVDDYEPAPDSHFIEYHYGRSFYIHDTYPWRKYFSEAATGETNEDNEAIMPLAITSENWDDLRVPGIEAVDPQGLVAWGINMFIPLKQTWLRREGNDPDTWSYKKTWANKGISSPYTVSVSTNPAGIIGLSTPEGGNPGLSLFNGKTSDIFTQKYDFLFMDDLDHDYLSVCRGSVIGKYYILLYVSVASTTHLPDKMAVFDLSKYPDVRLAYWDGISPAGTVYSLCSYSQGETYYFGTSDGFLMKYDTASSETININVQTEDRIGGNPQLANIKKTLKRLKYNLDSNGDDVTMEIYIDGTKQTWPDGSTSQTITGTGDTVQVLPNFPPNFNGYKYSIELTGTGLTDFTLYSPWDVEFDATP
jgi:hypothetical protein